MSLPNAFDLSTSTGWLAIFTAIFLGFIVLVVLSGLLPRHKNLPPGPIGLPFVGYFPFLTRTPYKKLKSLSDRYGDVMSFTAFGKTIVHLGSFDAMRDAFITQGNEFAGRPELPFVDSSISRLGIIPTEGELWKIHRRFALQTLRDFGFGKLSLEGRVQQISKEIINVLYESKGKPIDIQELLANSAANVICSLLFDKNFKPDDPSFMKIRHSIKEFVNRTSPTLVFVVPIARFFPIKYFPSVKAFLETNDIFIKVVEQQIQQHQNTFDPTFLRDFVDAYLEEAKNIESAGQAVENTFTVEQMKAVVSNLFAAGTETTSNTMHWLLRILMFRPEMQSKLQAEIDEVVGRERLPSVMDRPNMPFTEATINEVLRLSSLTPLSVFHSNPEEVKFRGYVIPKRSVIIPNLWAIHYDPKYWPEPEKFDPTRFLSKEGKLVKRDSFLPFSAGKRFCLGETLARMELFLYTTFILQRYTIEPTDCDTDKSLKIQSTLFRSLPPYKLCARERC